MLYFPDGNEKVGPQEEERNPRPLRIHPRSHGDEELWRTSRPRTIIALDTKIGKLDLSIHREVETIQQQLKNVEGFGKGIDRALERIAAIEKHLGINKKIAVVAVSAGTNIASSRA